MDSSATPEIQPPASAPSMSLAARLGNIFTEPGEVFEAVKTSPPCPANWLVPAVLLVLVSWLLGALVLSKPDIQQQIREISERALEGSPAFANLPPAQAENLRQMSSRTAVLATSVVTFVGPLVSAFVAPFGYGLFFWLCGAKLLKGGFTYMKAVEAAGLIGIIGTLEAALHSLLILGTGNIHATPSLSLLVMKSFDPQNFAHLLLACLNIMTFWLLAVRSIALARLSACSLAKAAAFVFGLWGVLTFLSLSGVALGQILAHHH